MKNAIIKSERYQRLESYFRDTFTTDGHFVSYDEVREQSGVEIRAGRSPRGYQAFAQVRDHLRISDDPLMLEVVRGEGVERIRIGEGAHGKCYDSLGQIRRKSAKMIELAQTGRIHSVDDEEAFKNSTMARICSIIHSRTLRESIKDEMILVSNGYTPTRPFVSLRQLSKVTLGK